MMGVMRGTGEIGLCEVGISLPRGVVRVGGRQATCLSLLVSWHHLCLSAGDNADYVTCILLSTGLCHTSGLSMSHLSALLLEETSAVFITEIQPGVLVWVKTGLFLAVLSQWVVPLSHSRVLSMRRLVSYLHNG